MFDTRSITDGLTLPSADELATQAAARALDATFRAIAPAPRRTPVMRPPTTVEFSINCPRGFDDGEECGRAIALEFEVYGTYIPATRHEPAEEQELGLLSDEPTHCDHHAGQSPRAFTAVEVEEVQRRIGLVLDEPPVAEPDIDLCRVCRRERRNCKC